MIGASSQQVARGVSLVGQSGEALDRIVDRIADISKLAGNISQLAGTQANSLLQINVAVSEMDKMTQQNAAMVEESTAAARSLANEATQLTSLVGHFTLAGGSSSPITARLASAPVSFQPRPQPAPRAAVRSAPIMRGNLAVATHVADDDWSEF